MYVQLVSLKIHPGVIFYILQSFTQAVYLTLKWSYILIVHKVLLLDASLLLMHCVALRRAQQTYLISQTGGDESSCSSAASAHPKMIPSSSSLLLGPPLEGKVSFRAALQPHYPTARQEAAWQHQTLDACAAKYHPPYRENVTSSSMTGYWSRPSSGTIARAEHRFLAVEQKRGF